MAERMGASRGQLDRFLDPDSRDVQLATLTQAARVIGKRLRIEVVDAAWKPGRDEAPTEDPDVPEWKGERRA